MLFAGTRESLQIFLIFSIQITRARQTLGSRENSKCQNPSNLILSNIMNNDAKKRNFLSIPTSHFYKDASSNSSHQQQPPNTIGRGSVLIETIKQANRSQNATSSGSFRCFVRFHKIGASFIAMANPRLSDGEDLFFYKTMQ